MLQVSLPQASTSRDCHQLFWWRSPGCRWEIFSDGYGMRRNIVLFQENIQPIIKYTKYTYKYTFCASVPGIIGSLQALEAIKIACDMEPSFSQRLLLFDALDTFRTIKLRPRQAKCVVCGENPSVTELIDYVQFCGAAATDKVVKAFRKNPHEGGFRAWIHVVY